MTGINRFILAGFDSEEFGIIITAPPPEIFAERDVESICISGRSGDLIRDNGRYKNVTLRLECAIIPSDSESLRDAAIHAMPVLNPIAEYQRMETTYDPDHFRMARVAKDVSVESIVEQAGTFELQFDCKPQRFLKSGEFAQKIDSPTILCNDGMTAAPIIKVYGTGDGTVTVGGNTVQLLGMEDSITLDCEMQNAYREVDGLLENMNLHIFAPDFPVLLPGTNEVHWTGGVQWLEITPRWWTL